MQRLTARDTFREMSNMPPEYPPGGWLRDLLKANCAFVQPCDALLPGGLLA